MSSATEGPEPRLVSLELQQSLADAGYDAASISWQQDGLQARVIVNGHDIGELGQCWIEFREEKLIARLQAELSSEQQ